MANKVYRCPVCGITAGSGKALCSHMAYTPDHGEHARWIESRGVDWYALIGKLPGMTDKERCQPLLDAVDKYYKAPAAKK